MTYRTRRTKRNGKFNAIKCTFDGYTYDSKFEAIIAQELTFKKKAGEILDFDRQYRVDMYAYSKCLTRSLKKSHKVDFRVHNLNGTYTLLEAKGFETADYKDRAKWLDNFWLPLNPDYDYEVVYATKANYQI